MVDLSKVPDNDVKLLTGGKLISHLGIRDPYKMHRLRTEARLTKTKCKPAIYFLFYKKELIYIGKCTSLKDRLLDHARGRRWIKACVGKDGRKRGARVLPPKEFDTFSKLYITLQTAEYIEPIYITHFRPALNKVGVDQPKDQLDMFNYTPKKNNMTNEDIVKLKIFQDEAKSMLNELDNNRLVVKLDGYQGDQNRSRCVESKNVSWYRELFEQYTNGKNGKAARNPIRRYLLIPVLKNLSNGIIKDGPNYTILMDLIKDRLFYGYYIEEEGMFIPPQLTLAEAVTDETEI